jgi:hypothetical protein
MVPVQWASFPFTAGALSVIEIGELPASPPIAAIRRSGLPLTPAAEYLLDLVRRHKPDAPRRTAAAKGGKAARARGPVGRAGR